MLWFYLVQIYDLSITLYNASGLSMSIVSSFAHVHTLQLLAVLVHLNAKISQSTCPHWGAIFFIAYPHSSSRSNAAQRSHPSQPT